MPMTGVQRVIVAVGAALLAFRLLFPVKYGLRTDFYTTLLQAMGIFVVTAALFILGPFLGFHALWNRLKGQWFGLLLLLGWAAYALAAWDTVAHYGLASTVDEVLLLPTSLGALGFLFLVLGTVHWWRSSREHR